MENKDTNTSVVETGDQDDSALQALTEEVDRFLESPELETLTKEVDQFLADYSPTPANASANRKALFEVLPADLRVGYPASASNETKALWLVDRLAMATARKAVTVPVTDIKSPAVTTPEPDISGLSAVAKIARGYRN